MDGMDTNLLNDIHSRWCLPVLSPQTQESSSEEGFQHGLGDFAVLLKYVRLGAVRLKISTRGYKIVRLNEFLVRARDGKNGSLPACGSLLLVQNPCACVQWHSRHVWGVPTAGSPSC